ncbi:hypothetical protein DPMN_142922 [Dreissena polymorpha]|uniref:Uncharacterized protein n=1 Tax=Dreissena polymorpha TaxID=45954 RepID=A0A9D4GF87_DREPO|nr:hypothetical protein DPMN_142922 [Dreissena polymorpha]
MIGHCWGLNPELISHYEYDIVCRKVPSEKTEQLIHKLSEHHNSFQGSSVYGTDGGDNHNEPVNSQLTLPTKHKLYVSGCGTIYTNCIRNNKTLRESETVDLHIRLIRRKKYVTIHGRLHHAWDDYEEEKLTTTELLRIISHINALGPSTAVHHMLDDDES